MRPVHPQRAAPQPRRRNQRQEAIAVSARAPSGASLRLIWALLLVAACASVPGEARSPTSAGNSDRPGVAVYALSRGTGVPAATRAALERARALLEEERRKGVARSVERSRIGLEGETRLCAEFNDAASAQAVFNRLRKLTAGVDLLNVTMEPCGWGQRDRRP
jgi:hypothetical protein